MKKQILDNADVTSSSKQIAILKQHFPACFDRDGKFMPDKLAEIAQAEGADISREGYSLNWLGKSYARLMANLNTETLLAANTEHNEKDENKASENILIQGDNLDVLKHLKNAYAEQIKMIYIDPPYNTGKDGFVYNDDRKFTVEELASLAGIEVIEAKRILAFTQSNSNSHSAWLTFMYPRLYIAKELLKKTGVIFISIDDNEQAQLKALCDEVFGEENFEGQLHWRRRHNQPNDKTKMIGLVAEHIIVYAKNSEALKNYGVGKVDLTGNFKNPDKDSRGPWATKPWKAGSGQGGTDYQITSPTGKVLTETWMGDENTYKSLVKDNRIVWPSNGDGSPRKKYFEFERQLEGQCATNWWHHEQFGHNQSASDELTELFSGQKNMFSNPKPIKLMRGILQVTDQCNDFRCLDFFAGSGSTAHAIMALNAEDNGRRSYISVQLNEKTDSKSEARKAGYETVYEITRDRILFAAQKLQKEFPQSECDFGFKEFKTTPVFAGYLNEADTPDQYTIFEGDKLSDEERAQLLLTWQVYDGLPLTLDLAAVDLAGYTAHQGKHILYCTNSGLTLDHILKMLEHIDTDASFAPQKIVVFEYVLSSKAKREITEAIKGYNNRKQIELYLEIRL